MNRGKDWLVPLTGVVFFGLVVAAVATTGSGGDATNATQKTAQEITDHYKDHKDKEMIAAFLLGLASVFFVFFAGWLRKVLREAEGTGGMLSAVSLVGATVFAAGLGVAAAIHFTLADLADDLDPIAIQAINGIDYDLFFTIGIGLSIFMLATGISVVRHRALPKWLGWVAIVLGVVAYSPAGFFAFLLSLVWILAVSIILAGRARRGGTPAAGAAA